jgi:hypothetical protein
MSFATRTRRLATALAAWVLSGSGPTWAEEPVVLHYYARPPFMERDAGNNVVGLTATTAAEAFRKAGIPVVWKETPAKRQLVIIASNGGRDCGLGWYRTSERDAIGKFSVPIRSDRATVGVARREFTPASLRLTDLLATPTVRVLLKDGLTYGQEIPPLLAKAKSSVQVLTGEQQALAHMVGLKRADFMFALPEEAAQLTQSNALASYGLKAITFSDIKGGDTRHILCSKRVDEDTMARLNQALVSARPSP